MRARESILILGGATHENRGDRAMHAGLLRWLAENRPGLEPVFLASNPEITSQVLGVRSESSPDAHLAQPWNKQTRESTWQRVRSCGRGLRFVFRPGEFSCQLARAAAVFIPGSGSMNSQWWHDWLHVKAWEVLAARRAGVPVFATSQGVGPPFTHAIDVRVARILFNACEVVGTRDGEASAGILRACGVEAARVAFSGDDALLIEPDAEAASRWLGDFGAGHPLIAINARDSSSYGRKYPKPDLEFWIALLRGLAALPSSPHFLFLPVSYDPADDDRRPARSLAGALLDAGVPTSRLLVLEEPLDAPVLRGLAARATLGIGISYHFLLFCLAAGVPAFGLWQNPYYRAKIEGLMSLYQCSKQALGLSSISPEAMLADVEQMLADPSLQVNRLRSLGRELEASAQKTRARILDHLPLSPEPPQSCP